MNQQMTSKHILHFKNTTFEISKPIIMGILNVTPDSFSEVGRFQDIDAAVQHGIKMVEDGAAMIDIGGEPTNPSLNPVISLKQELERVVPVVEKLRKAVDVPISVDTSKPEVFEAVIAAGADIINDVRALRIPGALEVIAQYDVAVCLMHMAFPYGIPKQVDPYDDSIDILKEVKDFLSDQIEVCIDYGIDKNRIIIDPGIGAGNFGKTLKQNLQLLNMIEDFHDLQLPILIGASRKTFIGQQLDLPVEQRLNGSLAAAVVAATKGASIIRVHDVKETAEAIALTTAILNAG